MQMYEYGELGLSSRSSVGRFGVSDQTFLQGQGHGLQFAVGLELGNNALGMAADGRNADKEKIRDIAGAGSLGHQVEHFKLPFGKPGRIT